jgi:hypothetical protein
MRIDKARYQYVIAQLNAAFAGQTLRLINWDYSVDAPVIDDQGMVCDYGVSRHDWYDPGGFNNEVGFSVGGRAQALKLHVGSGLKIICKKAQIWPAIIPVWSPKGALDLVRLFFV